MDEVGGCDPCRQLLVIDRSHVLCDLGLTSHKRSRARPRGGAGAATRDGGVEEGRGGSSRRRAADQPSSVELQAREARGSERCVEKGDGLGCLPPHTPASSGSAVRHRARADLTATSRAFMITTPPTDEQQQRQLRGAGITGWV